MKIQVLSSVLPFLSFCLNTQTIGSIFVFELNQGFNRDLKKASSKMGSAVSKSPLRSSWAQHSNDKEPSEKEGGSFVDFKKWKIDSMSASDLLEDFDIGSEKRARASKVEGRFANPRFHCSSIWDFQQNLFLLRAAKVCIF